MHESLFADPGRPEALAYFAGVDEEVARHGPTHVAVLADARALLARLDLAYLRPESTGLDRPAEAVLGLAIRHTVRETRLVIQLSSNEVVLHWPGGTYARPQWTRDMANVAEALLVGRNRLRTHLVRGKVVRVETEVWDPEGRRRPVGTLAPVGSSTRGRRLLRPGARTVVEQSICFDRDPAIATTDPRGPGALRDDGGTRAPGGDSG